MAYVATLVTILLSAIAGGLFAAPLLAKRQDALRIRRNEARDEERAQQVWAGLILEAKFVSPGSMVDRRCELAPVDDADLSIARQAQRGEAADRVSIEAAVITEPQPWRHLASRKGHLRRGQVVIATWNRDGGYWRPRFGWRPERGRQ